MNSKNHDLTDPQLAILDPKLILIIDDDPDDIEITRRSLIKADPKIAIRVAEGGEEALRMLQEMSRLPALILVDLKMCGMSGIDTLHRIRADERLKNMRVVVVTNSTLESDRKAALSAGADVFLHKAFDMEEFNRDIHAILERWVKD